MEIRDTRNGEWHWVNNAVVACPHITHADKSVYSALATFSGCQEIRPTFQTIAKRSATSERQAKKAISRLIEVGYIVVKKGGGRGHANVYELAKCSKGCKLCTVSKGCKKTQERVQNFPIKRAKNAPQLDKEIDKEVDNGFNEFWENYPKRVKKKTTEDIWKRNNLSKKKKEIIDFIGKAKKTEKWHKGFVPDPTTFLRQEQWEDDLSSYGEIKRRPYYRGDPVVEKNGKKYVIVNSEWLEFAGKTSDIIWK